MTPKTAIVVTSINPPTQAVIDLAAGAPRLRAEFYVIGDDKSPANFHCPGVQFFDMQAQRSLRFAYAREAPARHYARKNVGYLLAIEAGAGSIIETDDDNLPLEDFWLPRRATVATRRLEQPGWLNVYAYFSSTGIWPRGLPLDRVLDTPPVLASDIHETYCPIQQGLADDNPDVDAIYRLTAHLPVTFDRSPPVALRHAFSPFNSQNTTWFPAVYPLLYLPYHCSFRMTDIWRSFVAQHIAYLNGWHVLYHASTVRQDRNEHNLMRDFEEEIPGYLHNARIRNELQALELPAGEAHIPDAMRICYRRLVDLKLVGAQELPLLDAWLADLAGLPPVPATEPARSSDS